MADYEFLQYETHDDGTIVRILLDRPDARNAQNRGLLVELDEAFLRAEADDTVRVVILGGTGHDVLLGPRHGLEAGDRGVRHPSHHEDQRRHPHGRREADAPGVALLLREHAPVAQPAQDHHRPGARPGVRRRPDADVVVRPHRRRRRRRVRRRGRHPPRHVRPGVLRPPVGARRPARPRSSCSRATASTSHEAHRLGMVSKVFPRAELEDSHPRRSPAASPSCRP